MVVRKAVFCKWLLLFIFTCQGFISHAQLTADFSAVPVSGCAPLLVNFTDLSTGNPTAWKWDLGNGTISFLKNPAVTYFAPGQYTVTLTVTNAGGSNQVVKTKYITVYDIPFVGFTGTPTSGCFPLPVQFTDQSLASSGTITSREWDFGDGNISGIQNPLHTYNGVGNFNVSLRITNSFGCVKTVTKPQYIQVGSGAHASFTNDTAQACKSPAVINFKNTSTGTGALTYLWDFGDGTTSAAVNPTHSYSVNGVYTIKLAVTNSTGCTDTITKKNLISVGVVKAEFLAPGNVCQGEAMNITNTSIPVPLSVSWYFGDGTTTSINNPVKAYNTPGNYTIKLVANFGGCVDSVSHSINVSAKPVVTFTADKTAACKPPLTVNFTGTVTGGISYSWDFGDGTTSTQQNPSHTYTSPGSYDVKLVGTNVPGCKDSLIKPGYIKIQSPVAGIANLPAKGCAPFTTTFFPDVNAVDPVVSYYWDFGDGSTSTLANPVHTFASGTYNITLAITTAGGCSDTITVTNGVLSGNKASINFTAFPRDVCAFKQVTFTDLSTGGDKWLWEFGDGSTSTLENPTHAYNDTGFFDITLVVWNNGCSDSLKFSNYIHISPPIAIFKAAFDCAVPKQRVFTDLSIGADTWQWDFGDGTTSTQQSPVHTYADTGSYTVSLTVTNNITGCSHTTTQLMHVIIEKADFTASDTVICINSSINFLTKNSNPSNIQLYQWDFGDGTSASSDTNQVSHTYIKRGKYSVSLTITDVIGCRDSVTKNLYINVDGPTAAFRSSLPGICLNNAVTFTDSSFSDGIHPIQQWIWNFGDSTSQTYSAPPFLHTYAAPGMYSVMLKVVDSKGCMDSISQVNNLIISKPFAAFAADDTISCHTDQITFTNFSVGPMLTYLWNFGDGNTSTAINPVHQYASEGTYTVSLKITDQYGCTDSIVKKNYILIADPHANFSMSDSLSTCPPLVVKFTNLSTGFSARSWDFGDGTSSSLDDPTHFYTLPGTYNIVLTATGYNGCSDTKTKQIVVRGPQGSFTYSNIVGCNPLKTDFVGTTKDNITFIWDFNDGSAISTPDSIISHTYINPGSYLPKMILVDPNGCQVPIVGTDTIKVFGVKADFISATTTLCDSGFIQFNDLSSSNDVIAGYLWNFGDGSTSTLQNPVHSYNATGLYNTTLTVTTQAGCTDVKQYPSPVKIVTSPKIGITSNSGVCIPAAINFAGNILVPDSSSLTWSWDFGNGNISSLQNPTQVYSAAGSFVVKLLAVNSSGCKDSVTKTIVTYPLPSVKANAGSWLCEGQTVNLSASGAASYSWSPAAGLSCTTCANPVAKPDSSTKYFVQGTSVNGCIASDSVMLSVQLPFAMLVGKGDTLCKGKSAQLFASGAGLYSWSPVTAIDNPAISNPTVTPLTTTNYMVIGSDNKGCFKDTGYVPITVFPIPTVQAGSDKTINVGQTIDLLPTISNDVTSVTWTPTSGIFRNIFPGITAKPSQTTEFKVEVKNNGGCIARDNVTVYVLCNNANVFIPNTFSPNGDGANDIFYPRGTGLFSIKSFRIYNRWGEVVFEKASFNANDPSSGWDGTYKGRKLDPDVFVYTIDIVCDNNTTLTYKGNIALIK